VSDEFAVFVSPEGDDDEDGTMASPVATITRALELAEISRKLVLACAGGTPYAESGTLVISDTVPGIFGAFDCESWSYEADLRAEVNVADPVALQIRDTLQVTIENLSITASDATDSGASSLVAIVSGSEDVSFRRVTFTAGDGATGMDGMDGVKGADGSEAGTPPTGQPADCVDPVGSSQLGGTWPGASSCSSRGGAGGEAFMSSVMSGGSGIAGTPLGNVTPSGVQNGGPGEIDAGTNMTGAPGSNGNRGSQGDAAGAIGAFSANGYAPASGHDGGDGFPGQGGGGGGASKGSTACLGASGGAGGMGGCGGTKGTGGQGGGASIALLVLASGVTIEESELVAGEGGDGGDGGSGGDPGLGQVGANGGTGDATFSIRNAGRGGDGGNGGPGGSGSGGTGGPSIALAYSGAMPSIDGDSTLGHGEGGLAGDGGTVGAVTAPNGSAGVAAATRAVN
jgi:hypothetical protein